MMGSVEGGRSHGARFLRLPRCKSWRMISSLCTSRSFAFMGLVSSLILQAISSGALEVPQRTLTFSAFFHTVRLFGGEIGVAVMGRFIAEREKLHSNLLGLQVQRGEWISEGTVRDLTAGLAAKSNGLAGAAGRALGIVDGKVRLQAYALTFIDAFHLVVWTCVGVLFVIAMLHRSPMNFRDLGSLQGSTSTGEAKP
jgi:DHA2 family multidrug resistance protein